MALLQLNLSQDRLDFKRPIPFEIGLIYFRIRYFLSTRLFVCFSECVFFVGKHHPRFQERIFN